MKQTCLTAIVSLASLASLAGAAKVKTWHHARPADHDRAKLKGVVVDSTGTLRLARRLRPLARLDATHVWAVVEAPSGALYAGTGGQGKVYRITPDGKAVAVYTSPHGQVLSLAASAKSNAVYAGTGPTADIVRIDGDNAKVLCTLDESYVWALAAAPKGDAVYAATGPRGRIYRITPDGKARLFYDTKQDHVLCLAVAGDGTVYAGTDKTGRIYRIDANGKAFVLHQAVQSEVRTLLLDGDTLFAGTSATKRRGSTTTARRDDVGKAAAVFRQDSAVRAATDEKAKAAKAISGSSGEKDVPESTSAPSPKAPSAGENAVYRIALDGSAVREVYRGKVLVLSLLKPGKNLLVGTGLAGQLFEIDEAARAHCELARLEHGQVLGLMRRKDGSVVLAAGDPGQLYVLEPGHAARGTVTSDVLDAKLVSRWGALRWRAVAPAKTAVKVAVRSGNVAEVDETWSEWTDEEAAGDEATIKAPAARFLQYRVTLTSADTAVTPLVRSLTLRYATANQAPEVTKVEVPNLRAREAENPKKLKIKWAATDANEDELRYSLYVKKDGWDSWVEIEDDLEKTELEWDTTTTPSGVYRVKVFATDRPDNPDGSALTGERVSEPFVVCHTAPAVTVKAGEAKSGRVAIEAKANSPLARLTGASFAVNGRKWANVFPTDGLFDSRREAFSFRTEALKPGAYVLVLRVKDAAGNTGSADVVFTVPKP